MSKRDSRFDKRSPSVILAVVFAVIVSSCAGDGTGLDENGDPISLTSANVAINPTKDNTLYGPPASNESNGVGNHLIVGRTGSFGGPEKTRRAVIAFDVAGSVPFGATITNVTLSLNLVLRSQQSVASDIDLHRMLADWGEGTSQAPGNEGISGGPATTGDATWLHRFFDTELWTTPGGDFSPTVSATQNVDALGVYVWSGSGMAADTQAWLDDPGTNFGWLLTGGETTAFSSKGFDSGNNPDTQVRPLLEIRYALVESAGN